MPNEAGHANQAKRILLFGSACVSQIDTGTVDFVVQLQSCIMSDIGLHRVMPFDAADMSLGTLVCSGPQLSTLNINLTALEHKQ